MPVTHGVAGSSPVRTAKRPGIIDFRTFCLLVSVGWEYIIKSQASVAPLPATQRATAMRPNVGATHLPQAAHAVPTCCRRHAPENAIVAVRKWRTSGTLNLCVCSVRVRSASSACPAMRSGVPLARMMPHIAVDCGGLRRFLSWRERRIAPATSGNCWPWPAVVI